MQLLNPLQKKSVLLSPNEFLKIYNDHADNIEAVNIILPRIGIDSISGNSKWSIKMPNPKEKESD